MSASLETSVLELSRVGPTEFCTRILAEMGADVLKVEAPATAIAPGFGTSPAPDAARNIATNYLNRNKRSMTLNLKEPRAREVLQRLASNADVLVEGFRPGVMKRLGGDYETLSKINPRLVYCSLSGFGQGGPYRDMPAHDINYISLAGLLGLIGEADRLPAIPLNIVADYGGASMHAAVGILLALLARHRTGRGQFVDISYLDTTLALVAGSPPVHSYLTEDTPATRGHGAFSGKYVYYGVYETKDGRLLSIGCMEEWLWDNFCEAVQRPDLKRLGPREEHFFLPANEEQAKGREELSQLMRTRTRDEWFEMLSSANVCVGKVYDVPEIFDDPQLRYRQMVSRTAYNGAEDLPQVGVAIKLSDTPGSVHSPAPHLGKDTEDVLRALGYSEMEVAELQKGGVT